MTGDIVVLAWADIAFMHHLAGARFGHKPWQFVGHREANEQVGFWARAPIAQWLLGCKLNGIMLIEDGEEAWKKACRNAMDIQSRVIAAYNDAAVNQCDIWLINTDVNSKLTERPPVSGKSVGGI